MSTLAKRTSLSAGTLIGDKVNNRAGDNVGSVKEIMIDLNSGRISYVVVSVGGFLGIGDKLFAIPWKALEVDTDNHALLFDVSKEQLEQAPGFDQDDWPDMADPKWGQAVHAYYKTKPYWELDS
ncbi:PRC-barrel domain protein [Posidoniimonas polymericola]|uniref:PRC-barrel domain protein n=1 Tax=Posidoniimonas polymericola TaxID=2528002 RepID=A0A5C5YGB1_9BACT|nr:PRC-barrel domain-containing protein [Posidoniimonas polymericola]TWT73425.1 PRC-barrel domain protein [Posidoniimonas polymericola]